MTVVCYCYSQFNFVLMVFDNDIHSKVKNNLLLLDSDGGRGTFYWMQSRNPSYKPILQVE